MHRLLVVGFVSLLAHQLASAAEQNSTAALAGLAVIAAGAVVLWPRTGPSSRITEQNFVRIQPGMTLPEVMSMFGPPGDHRTGPIFGDEETLYVAPSVNEGLEWLGDHGCGLVVFDSSGCALSSSFEPSEPVELMPLATVVWRAKRQWHRWFP
jgi:hypothetical protein